MPELPEVETVARALREGELRSDGTRGPSVIGQRIQAVRLLWLRTLAMPAPEEFFERLTGQTILAVSRRAKYLLITLERDTLILHLRMSGRIRVEDALDESGTALPLLVHDRLVLEFLAPLPGLRLVFNDARKFGRAWLVSDPLEVLQRLGPEPFDPQFTAELLYNRLTAVHRQIKPLLLDQSFLAGLGNIYTDEALHLSQIHPLRNSASITPTEAEQLWRAIRVVLSNGIDKKGASFDWVYQGGDFAFQVYDRDGKPCPRCGEPLVKMQVGQRGTHYCPHCQQL